MIDLASVDMDLARRTADEPLDATAKVIGVLAAAELVSLATPVYRASLTGTL